ncbi:methyltransferase family protein [Sphingomicrobium clamense]|uniref:Isoprenylcysteine carboxylmethyltransferase family protein n=1 Tax=Sphingomicrobium clamense TaxID=2851013 RepID=A0ABS6V488_9SPHN|nr:isoprenylcysteine carboxylmethyltransferase family protein [Sphingomicrobium sp. B8]MBW0144377.1 isoprenylcysteine carboxylmethyltransferase family protein [Sphingomicrobium sp. B8]
MGDGKTAGVIAPPPLIFGVTLVVGLVLHAQNLGLDITQDWPGRAFGGAILCIFGATLIMLAILRFRAAETPPEPWKETTAFVKSGVYRLTRNPMYLGMASIYAGITVIAGCLLLLGLFVPVLVTIHRGVILREEKYLSAKFGDDYDDYRRTTRRWI